MFISDRVCLSVCRRVFVAGVGGGRLRFHPVWSPVASTAIGYCLRYRNREDHHRAGALLLYGQLEEYHENVL